MEGRESERKVPVMAEDGRTAVQARDAGQAYSLLKNKIVSMEIEPGEKLSENALSAQLHLGRVQVREGLAQLAEEGYIKVYPQRGTEVTLIDRSRLRQAVHAHIVLEQAVIQELCGNRPEEDELRQLEESMLDRMPEEDAADTLEFLNAEHQFHDRLAEYAGHGHIKRVFRMLDCDLLRVSYLLYRTFNYHVSVFALTGRDRTKVECRMLLNNIRRGDAEAAVLICANHFNAVLGNADLLRGIYPRYFTD